MDRIVIYIHGKGGSATEAEHYRALFPDADVIGFDYHSQTPWEAREEFPAFYDEAAAGRRSVSVVANSIGAYFTLCTLGGRPMKKAFLISPIVDMEKLILNMMRRANVTEAELRERKEIPTEAGETLSWKYLSFARENPIEWRIPAHILYGGKDNLTARDTIAAFAEKIGAVLTVMENGEHWFHTDEQMNYLDEWVKRGRTS